MICERGPWDTLVDVIADTDLTDLASNSVGKMIVRQVHGSSKTFLIARDIDKILPLRPDLAGDIKIKKRYELYLMLADKFGWTVIDNNQDLGQAIEDVYRAILDGSDSCRNP